jgi:predicted Zn-dependent peptidase
MFGGSNINLNNIDLSIYNIVKDNATNYMKTLFIPLPNSTTVTVGLFINAGSRSETKAYGIAHFLEHMTFKGTINVSSIDLMTKLDTLGTIYNAMTSHEFTLYYISGNPRDINILLNTIIDLYLNPLFPQDDIEKERNVVLEELKMNEDNNHRYLLDKIYENIYSSSIPDIARPIIGSKNTILKFNRNDIMNFRRKNYYESNCLFCVSGNFKIDNVIRNIEDRFNAHLEKIFIGTNMFHDNITTDKTIINLYDMDPNMSRYIHINKNIKQTIIYFVFNSYNIYNKYELVTKLLCDILSNGFSSRFFNLLRNILGISYYNDSYNRAMSDNGQFIITVGVRHNAVVRTITAVLNELHNIITNGITENELIKAKKQNSTSLLFLFKDPYEYLSYYGMSLLKRKPLDSLSDILYNIENISMDDMNTVIKNIFNKKNIVIGTIGPISKKNNKTINKIISKLINNF